MVSFLLLQFICENEKEYFLIKQLTIQTSRWRGYFSYERCKNSYTKRPRIQENKIIRKPP